MKRNNWLILAGITIIHFLLKLFFPDDIGLWYSEVMNVLNTQKSWTEILETNTTQQIQPLYLLLLLGWEKIVGMSDDNLRLLSVILSTFTAGSLYVLAIKHFKPNVVIYASLLFLVSGLDLHYSHEVQYYALSSLLAVWSFYFFFEIWENPEKKLNLIMLLTINVFLLYTHSLTYFILITQLVAVLILGWKQKKSLLQIVAINFIAFVSFLPWINRMLNESHQLIQQATWKDLLDGLVDMAMGEYILAVYALFFFVIGMGTIFYQSNNKKNEGSEFIKLFTLILWFFLPIVGSFFVALLTEKSFIFQDVLYVTVGFVLLVAFLLENLPIGQMYKMIPFGILIVVLLTKLEIKNYNHQDIKKAITQAKQVLDEEGAIFLQTADIDILFAYYYDRKMLRDYKTVRAKLKKQHIYVGNDATWMKYQELKNYTKVLLIQSFEEYTDPNGTLVTKFSEVFKKASFYKHYQGIRLYEFIPIKLENTSVAYILEKLPKIKEEEKVLGMIEEIEKKKDWNHRVILKAKERNISADIMKCLDAIFVLKDEYPQFLKYKEEDILNQIIKIKANSDWIGKISVKAKKRNVSTDIMTVLDAMYVLQQIDLVYQQEVEQKLISKYNYIKGDTKWQQDIAVKAKERNITSEMMICLDAIYVLNQEDSLFANYSVEKLYTEVQNIQGDKKWSAAVIEKAKNRNLSIELVLFFDAIYNIEQKAKKSESKE